MSEPEAKIKRLSRVFWEVRVSCDGQSRQSGWGIPGCHDSWTTFTHRGAVRSSRRWIARKNRENHYKSLPEETING